MKGEDELVRERGKRQDKMMEFAQGAGAFCRPIRPPIAALSDVLASFVDSIHLIIQVHLYKGILTDMGRGIRH